MAAILAGLTYPLYTRLLRVVRGREPVAAALTLVMWKIYGDTFGEYLLTPEDAAD